MKALIFDTETTDLIANSLLPDKHQPRIIEFFGHIVDIDTGEVFEELEFLCHPGFEITKIISDITGIKPSDLEGKPPFKEFAPKVIDILSKAKGAIAHNLSYDYAIVDGELRRCGITDIPWPMARICTVQETEWYKGFRLNLTGLHEFLFGEPFKDAHRARHDVAALTRCVIEMRRRGDL